MLHYSIILKNNVTALPRRDAQLYMLNIERIHAINIPNLSATHLPKQIGLITQKMKLMIYLFLWYKVC